MVWAGTIPGFFLGFISESRIAPKIIRPPRMILPVSASPKNITAKKVPHKDSVDSRIADRVSLVYFWPKDCITVVIAVENKAR